VAIAANVMWKIMCASVPRELMTISNFKNNPVPPENKTIYMYIISLPEHYKNIN
jgi:hypothetical protein